MSSFEAGSFLRIVDNANPNHNPDALKLIS